MNGNFFGNTLIFLSSVFLAYILQYNFFYVKLLNLQIKSPVTSEGGLTILKAPLPTGRGDQNFSPYWGGGSAAIPSFKVKFQTYKFGLTVV